MPKLSLKETPAEKEEKEWRRMKKAARKASRYAQLDDPPQAESSRRSWKQRHARSVPDDDLEGDTPGLESRKADAEEDWNAKLFEAMEWDSAQDSAHAWFNSFVPPRWRNSPELATEGPSTLHQLDDDAYAEYMRKGMWERTHRAELEDQRRRKAEAKERRKLEKEKKEKLRQMEQEEIECRRRKREEKTQRALIDGWAAYESRWSKLQKLSAQKDADAGRGLTFQDLPWPVYPFPSSPESLTKEAITAFLFSDLHSQDKTKKQRLREAFLLYHPDRFEGRFMHVVNAKDVQLVKDAAGRVVRTLNDLADDVR